MTPTTSSKLPSTGTELIVSPHASSIRVRSPRTFPNHGIDYEEFLEQRFRIKDRIDRKGSSTAKCLMAYLWCGANSGYPQDQARTKATFLLRANYEMLRPFFDGNIHDDAA